MERWHETPGAPWLHRELVEPAPDAHLAAVVLGRGYAHQSVPDLGVATAVAGVLKRDLTGPVETAAGEVAEVRAQVEVDLQDTLVLLSGTEPALRVRLQRLADVLADPERADLTLPVERVGHPHAESGREVAAWFGAGPASLSCHVDPADVVTPDALRTALRALDPATDTPAVGFTTLEPLVGTVFTGPVGQGPPSALRWRRPGPGSLTDAAPTALVSVGAELSAAGWAAQRLLLDLLRDGLRLAGVAGVAGTRVAATTVGTRRFAVVHAIPSGAGFDRLAVHAAVVRALDAGRALPTGRLQQTLYAMRDEQVRSARTHPVTLLLETLRTGVEQRSRHLDADLEATTPDDVAAALRRLLDTLLVGQPPRAEPPRDYPVVTPVPGAPEGGPDSVHRARFATRLGEGDLRLTRAELRGDRLVTLARPITGRGEERVADAVDLSRLVARFDRGDPGGAGSTTLVDADDHRVVIPWAALARRGSLRRAVDDAAPADRVRALPADPAWEESIGRHRGRSRRIGGGVVAALVLFLGLLAVVVGTAGDDDYDGTVDDVAFGEEGELENGTTIEVSELRPADGGSGLGSLRLADVRFCGGGPIEQDGVQENGRNYVSPSRFRLEGTPHNTLTVDPPGADLLREATVAEGDCLEGVIGFQVPEGTPDVGVAVQYANGLGDQITWR